MLKIVRNLPREELKKFNATGWPQRRRVLPESSSRSRNRNRHRIRTSESASPPGMQRRSKRLGSPRSSDQGGARILRVTHHSDGRLEVHHNSMDGDRLALACLGATLQRLLGELGPELALSIELRLQPPLVSLTLRRCITADRVLFVRRVALGLVTTIMLATSSSTWPSFRFHRVRRSRNFPVADEAWCRTSYPRSDLVTRC